MDLDEIKRDWKAQRVHIELLEAQNEKLRSLLSVNSNTSRRDQIRRKYWIFTLVAFIMAPGVFLFFPSTGFSWLLTWIFAIVFIIEGIGNGYVLSLINKLNFATMSTRDALRSVIRLEKARRNVKRLLIAIVVSALTLFFYEVSHYDASIMIGGLTGAVIGAFIGYKENREIRNIIKEMKRELAELESDE